MRSVVRTLCLWLLPAAIASACELRTTWKHDPPYQYEDEQHRLTGLEIEVARAALARIDCRLTPVELPFARAMAELEAGRVDLVPGVLPRPDRERYARFSLPGLRTRNLVFLRSDLEPGQRVTTLAELRASNLRLGLERGTAYLAELKTLLARPGPERRLEEATSLEGLLRMLQMRRIDAFVADEYSTTFLARQLGLAAVMQATPIVIDDDAPVFAFSRQQVKPELVERFNAALQALQRDGTLKRLETQFLHPPLAAQRRP
ncbi:substrate-binding periplasmic protein [Roseateles sp. NT4]|uniref:substrate-binding periplasmic protein n=1 Tax=Roseateles sp. NT4 TaxID=3453715 RepID=UPI003EED9F1A